MSPPAWQMKRFGSFYDFTLVFIYSKWASSCHADYRLDMKNISKMNAPPYTCVKPKHFRFFKGFPCHTKKKISKGKITWRSVSENALALKKELHSPPKNGNSVTFYSSLCCFNSVWVLSSAKHSEDMLRNVLDWTMPNGARGIPTQAVWRLLGEVS